MMVRGICIRLTAPSCMRAPPEAVNTISGASCSTASFAAATMPSPTAAPIEPAMNAKSITATTARCPPIVPCATAERIVAMRRVARRAQAVGVALAVAEAQRVGRHFRQLDAGELALVERPAQPLLARCARRWWPQCGQTLQVLLQLGVEDHLLAGGTLQPEIVRHLAPGEQRADARADVFGEPAHARSLPSRAPRTPAASARTWSSTRSHGLRRRAAVLVEIVRQRVDQRRSHHRGIGDPRRRPPPAAGVRTPKPTAIGRSVTRRTRGIAAARSVRGGAARAGDPGDRDVVDEAGAAVRARAAGARRRWSARPGG